MPEKLGHQQVDWAYQSCRGPSHKTTVELSSSLLGRGPLNPALKMVTPLSKCSCLLQVFSKWTHAFASDPELRVILAANKANTVVHHKRQVSVTVHVHGS